MRSRRHADEGHLLTNWVVRAKLGDGSTPPPRREDWSRQGRLDEALHHLAHWRFDDWVDFPALVRRAATFYEYPMCDRDPLERWGTGRVTLVGDAAHPIYPVGSNGAAQATLDGRVLARAPIEQGDVVQALRSYEAERLAATSPIVLSNRQMGPQQMIDLVAARAPQGFTQLDDVISGAELEEVAGGYRKVAGFECERPSRGQA